MTNQVEIIRKRAGTLLRMDNAADKTAGVELLMLASEIERNTPSARITGDKDRENPVEGAPPHTPMGAALIYAQKRIDTLSGECQRLRTVLQYIEDAAYVDHQSGEQNFEALQSIARDGLQ